MAAQENVERMRVLLHQVVCELVDRPDEVKITSTLSDAQGVAIFSVKVGEGGEVGKVIGKRGRNADALRVIFESIATKYNQRAILDIADSHSHHRSRNHAAG